MPTGSDKSSLDATGNMSSEVKKYLTFCAGSDDLYPDVYIKALARHTDARLLDKLRDWASEDANLEDLTQEIAAAAVLAERPSKASSNPKHELWIRVLDIIRKLLKESKLQVIPESEGQKTPEPYFPMALRAKNFLDFNLSYYHANGFKIKELAKKYRLDRETIQIRLRNMGNSNGL